MSKFGVAGLTIALKAAILSSECMKEDAQHEFTKPMPEYHRYTERTPTVSFLAAPLPNVALSRAEFDSLHAANES